MAVSPSFEETTVWPCQWCSTTDLRGEPHARFYILTEPSQQANARWHISLWTTMPDSEFLMIMFDADRSKRPRGRHMRAFCQSGSGRRPPWLFNVYISIHIHLINLSTKSNDSAPTGCLQNARSAPGLHIALWDCDNYLLQHCHLTPTPAAVVSEKLICSMCLSHRLDLCFRCLRLVKESWCYTAAINSLCLSITS